MYPVFLFSATYDRLRQRNEELACYNCNMKQNIWKYESVESLRDKWDGKISVLCGGCFDLMHYGHFSFLRDAKASGDILIIALESDEAINKRKHRTPIHSQLQRAEILASLDVVDYVILLPFFTEDKEYGRMVEVIRPSLVAVTKGDPNIERKRKQTLAVGADVVEVSPLLEAFSTSKILNSL